MQTSCFFCSPFISSSSFADEKTFSHSRSITCSFALNSKQQYFMFPYIRLMMLLLFLLLLLLFIIYIYNIYVFASLGFFDFFQNNKEENN